jgi:hypothetical protein
MTTDRHLRKDVILLYRCEDVIGRYLVGNGGGIVAERGLDTLTSLPP